MKAPELGMMLGIGLGAAQLFGAMPGMAADAIRPLPCERIGFLELKTVKEPSGICYHSTRKTLFVVDDSGVVCEFKPDGRVVKQKQIQSCDFEGITHDPATGLLYLAIEGKDSILEVDPETLSSKREFQLPRQFQGKAVMKKGGQGIEAITFIPDAGHAHGGTFWVANQSSDLNAEEDLSAVIEVEVPLKAGASGPEGVKLLRYFRVPVIDIAGLCWDAPREVLYAISDAANQFIAFTRTGELIRSWSLPGDNQEGVTLDSDRVLYIAQDSGGVLKLKIHWREMSSGK